MIPLWLRAIVLSLILISNASAHEVFGTVEVILKGDKKKPDLSTVFVYLEPAVGNFKTPEDIIKRNYTMATKNKQFTPRSLAVPVGAGVQFPNFDSIFHNIFSVSAPNRFDLGLYKGGASKTQVFQQPGIVKVFCNVHPQMSATIVVAGTPFYTLADRQGNFTLGDIPIGSYQLRAYSDEGQAMKNITAGDKEVQVKLTIDGRSFKKARHKNKFGKDYSTDENERY